MEGTVTIPFTQESPTAIDFDLSGLTPVQINSLAIDSVVALAKLVGERPTDTLRSMIKTAPAGM